MDRSESPERLAKAGTRLSLRSRQLFPGIAHDDTATAVI